MPLATVCKWEDHFLGLTLDSRYRSVLGPLPSNPAGYPSVKISQGGTQGDASSVGGRVSLQTNVYLKTNCRLRFGEDPGSAANFADVRNWSVRKNAIGESNVSYNSTTYLQSSVGFVGYNDPLNFCEFYYVAEGATPSTWKLALNFNGTSQFIDTGFTHTPGVPFTARIETCMDGGVAKVEAYINDVLVTSATSTGQIPLDPLAWEYNIYNFPKAGGGFSNSAMWIDWLLLQQDL